VSSLRIALAQLNVTVGDLDGNRRLIEQAIRQAHAWLADLLVVPELAITGYPPEDLLLKPSFIEANAAALRRLIPLIPSGLVVLVGYVDRDLQGRLYNAAAVLTGGRQIATYRKQCLPNYGVFDEKRYFTAGTQSVVVKVAGWRVGVTICEDLWEEQPAQDLAEAGCHLMANLSASPYYAGKLPMRQRVFSHRAKAHHMAIAYCNLVGGQDELIFDGASLVLDARGRVRAQGRQFREDHLIVDVLPEWLGAAGNIRSRIAGKQRVRPLVAASQPPLFGHLEEVYEALVLGLRDYVRKNGFEKVVLGLSGGVDSALTACLAVDALGANQVVGVVMPSRYSSRATQADARALAKVLGIDYREISIEPAFRAYLSILRPIFKGCAPDTTEQNIQARIRGNLLMALSNKFGWLVLTTGNKSELATGYCTLYGDMAGGFAVIKDVPKTLVYQLAWWRNRSGREGRIPSRVLRRAPTAELAAHQIDQDTLPPYPMLDRLVHAYVEEDRSVREILRENRAPAHTVQHVVQMIDRSEYKRRQGAPGMKITPKAFGRDRRMPITNRYHQSQ